MEKNEDILIAIKPLNTIVKVPVGSTLISAIEKANIMFPAICGGKGKCGKCKIKIINEQVPYTRSEEIALKSEEINDGIHLACQVKPGKDLEVEILNLETSDEANQMTYSTVTDFEIDEHLKKIYLELKAPELNNPVDDLFNLETCISNDVKNVNIPLSMLQNLSTFLRKNNYKITLVLSGSQVLCIEPGDTTFRSYGLAFDLGTTSIAGILIDLKSGKDLAVHAKINPQSIYGADVITRVNFAINEPGGLSKLQNIVIESINEIIEKLAEKAGVSFREIYEMSVAGNTIMNHIFLGVNPQYIGESPYIPTFRAEQNFTAEELGLTLLPKASVMILPNISGYIGGDITGFILAYNLRDRRKLSLSIDIGTNSEIVLGSKERLVCCSAAAGPAFEGGHISCGMRAGIGAIEKIIFDEKDVFYHVIGDVKPKGICGTGLIDLVAEMLKFEIINKSGKICKPETHKQKWFYDRIIEQGNSISFIVVPAEQTENKEPITITQKDIRELQLAKAAFMAGINILMRELNISQQDIEEVLVAGAFGTYINKYNAQFIGLIPPDIPPERIKFVGNASSAGAKKFLLSKNARLEAQRINQFANYIELSVREDFQNEFADAMFF